MRAHLRVAACIDSKLKEELLKVGQPENSNELPEPLTSEAIWHATRNYEQRQKCLRSETDDVAVSSVSAPTKIKNDKGCKTCAKPTSWNGSRYWANCMEHKDNTMDTSDMECKLAHCSNPQGDHNTAAHKIYGPRIRNYKANPPAPRGRRGSTGDRPSSKGSSRRGSKSPQKYSRNNSQNRDIVRRSKEDSEAVSSIAVDTVDEPEMDIMDEADMFVDSDRSSLEYIATTDYKDFASSSIGGLAIDQFDGALMDDSDPQDEEKGEPEETPSPHGSDTSVSPEDIIHMAVEVATEKMYEKRSRSGNHSECWPQECFVATSPFLKAESELQL